jgi:BlaI family transcriptional regulator, penicillinase repressor
MERISKLSRRERQVMDILYSLGQATAAEIHDRLADPPTFSATRAVIRTLQEKGHLRYEARELRYLYFPTVAVESARKSALAHLVSTFFEGSPTRLMAALLDHSKVSEQELESLEELIRRAKKESE